MPFSALLLQATHAAAAQSTDHTALLTVIWEVVRVLLPFGLSLYALIKSLNREDERARKTREAAAEERFHKLELQTSELDNLRKGHQQQFERTCDDFLRRFAEHESKLNDVSRIREEMAGMRAELKYVVEGYEKISTKLDRLLERQSK